MYKNYIFDLYGTLIDINTNESKRYLYEKTAEFYAFHNAFYTPLEFKAEYRKLCKKETSRVKKLSGVEHPDIKIENVFLQLFNNKGVDADIELAVHAGKFFRIISTKYIKLYDGVIELLDTLKKKNKKIYLLSNAQQIFTEPEMKALKIYDYFDGIVYSSAEEVSKPDRKFYNIVLNRYNLSKEESIMIGNDPITDIKGSYEVGLDSLYIHSNISPEIKDKLLSKFTIMDGDVYKIIQNVIL